jgi:glycine oxidase
MPAREARPYRGLGARGLARSAIQFSTVNVTVVGAGIVGCATAYELARRGAQVRVIDPGDPGDGATRASAGMLAPYIEGHFSSLLDLGVRSLALYDDFVQRVRLDSGIDVEYARSGTLQIAAADDEMARLTALARTLADAGVAHSLLDGPAVRRLEPGLSPDVRRALLIPSHGYVAAAPLTSALVAAAVKRGVVFERASVTRMGSGPSRVCLHTSAGRIESDAAVVAAGSWSPQIVVGDAVGEIVGATGRGDAPAGGASPDASPVVRPVRGQLVHLQTAAPVAAHVIWGPGSYIVPWKDGTALVGATVEEAGFDDRPTAGGVRGLLNAAIGWCPALEHAVFAGVRVGFRPGTADELPIVGRGSVPNVFYATGHFRSGVLLAPLTASLIATLVIDGREGPGLETMRPGRFGL